VSGPEWFEESDPERSRPEEGPAARRPEGGPPRRGALGPTIAVLAVLLFVSSIAAELLTDLWWFDSVGYRGVFTTQLLTKAGLFVVGFLLMALAVGSSLALGHRLRPFVIPVTVAQQTLEQYRRALEPLRRLGLVIVPATLGVLAGAAAMGSWQTLLLWLNGGDFGRKDAQFGLDIGFYVFTLPWLRFLVSFLTVVLVLALVAALLTHYVYGGLQLPGRGPSTRAAIIHVGVLGALLALLRAGAYWLDRYALTTQDSSLITGVTYTGDHAVLPTRTILAAAAVMCALFFVASMVTRSLRLPIIGVTLLTITAILVGTIYPALVQSLKVKPSERSLEAMYIGRNIEATRAAYGLDGIDRTAYAATTDAQPGQLRENADTVPGIRLVDPNVVSRTFQQFEGLRQYYAFPDTLDVDRYAVEGTVSDSVVAVRELRLSGVPAAQRNWVNDHTVYTHGYGFVGAFGNRRTAEGDPVFFAGGLDGKSEAFDAYEPRVYFGEESPDYSVVGAPAGATPREFDYPDDAGAGGQKSVTYAGAGGVPIGSFFRKLAYALKYREPKLILSDQVNPASRMLDHRSPKERVERVAPWLSLDGNIYPAVVDGRIQWIVDGYTTSDRYPNSRLTDLADATSDSVSEQSRVVNVNTGRVNYIRNSVKATVDAYDGTVRLYGWDTEDPLLAAWGKAFPGSVRPISEISGQLMAHVRYPQDLFKVQRQLLTKYHVTDAESFYTGQDFWRVPKDPTHDTQDQPAYYQSLAMPGQAAPTFSLVTTFIPTGSGREILRGFLSVDADAGNQAGKPSPDYGTLRLLELPRASAVDGPGQIQNQIKVSTERSQSPAEPLNLSQFITQNSQSGKVLTYGNLLTLPVGGGLLYVQPLYVQASKEGGSFPQIKATVAVFGKKVAWGETLDQALDGLFGGNSGATTGDAGTGSSGPATPGGTPAPAPGSTSALAAAVAEAQAAYAAGEEALTKGDFAAYGEAQKRLEAALAAVAAAASGLTPPTEVPSSPSPSASPSP
jgi:uncharacterized membrane protein (UPF0182 family)